MPTSKPHAKKPPGASEPSVGGTDSGGGPSATMEDTVSHRAPVDRDLYGEDDPLPEEEGSFKDEEGPDATRVGPPRKIVVVEGPDQNRTKRFNGFRLVIGRAPGCSLRLSDKSISRRHLELVQGAKGVLLRDLGSGNGTKVNGEKVEERLLDHNDLIEVGATKMRFVDEQVAEQLALKQAEKREEERLEKEKGEAEPKSEPGAADPGAEGENEEASLSAQTLSALLALPPGQKIAVGIAAGLILAVLSLALITFLKRQSEPSIDPREAAAFKKIELAKAAIDEGKYEDAAALATAAERLKPGVDSEGVAAEARKDMSAMAQLEQIRGLVEQQRFEDARAELARLPDLSGKIEDQRRAVLAQLDARQADYLSKTAEDALAVLDVAAAKQVISQLPPDRQKVFQSRLREAEVAAKRQEKLHERETQKQREAAKRRAMAEHVTRLESTFRPVERQFELEDYHRAMLECDRVLDRSGSDPEVRERAERIKAAIPLFERSYQDGERKRKMANLEGALSQLKKAKQLYEEMGFRGSVGQTLDEHLTQLLVALGKAAHGRGDLATTVQRYKEALRINPRDETAREGLSRLSIKAEELYLEGYQVRESDPKEAARKYKLILEISPSDSDVYRKAKSQLSVMQP